jgi:hypothetical protein
VEPVDVLWGSLEDLEGNLRAKDRLACALEAHAQRDDGRIVRAAPRERLGMSGGVDVQPKKRAAVGFGGLVAEETDELHPA